jgi:hypothetical protein
MSPQVLGALTAFPIGLALGALALAGWPLLLTKVRRIVQRRRYGRHLRSIESEAETTKPSVTLRERSVDTSPISGFGAPYLYLSDLELTDLRCFAASKVDFRFPGEGTDLVYPNVNLLLGDNGSGKSTVLRAIAMAALGPVLDSSGFVPFQLVRKQRSRARVQAGFLFGGPDGLQVIGSDVLVASRGDLELVEASTAGRYWEDLYTQSTPSFFVVGYGTNRRTSDDTKSDPSQERGRRRRRYQRVSSLFDDATSLVPIGSWLPQAPKAQRIEVEELFRSLLPSGSRFEGTFESDEPVFRRRGVAVPLRALSDGFRSYVSWLGDLMFQLAAAAPTGLPLRDVGGIALVDEVDLLLHPAWQRFVVSTISQAFPKIQFVFTSHSPIVAGTLQSANIIVAREDEQTGLSSLHRIDAEVHGLNAEQVLLSSYFGLASSRSPDAVQTLTDLALRAVEGDPRATTQYLSALTGAIGNDDDLG